MLIATITAALLAAPATTPAPAPAPASERALAKITIASGERVTVRVDDEGRFSVVRRETSSSGEDTPVEPDTVRFMLGEMGPQTMLQVENGYGRGFEYRARMFRGARSARTSTCTVLAGMATYEAWPHPIDRIELSAPVLSPGETTQCAAARERKLEFFFCSR